MCERMTGNQKTKTPPTCGLDLGSQQGKEGYF